MKAKEFKKKIERIWHLHKKDWHRVVKNTERIVKQGEHYIKDQSEKGKNQLEIMALNLQREKLYYELGKVLARTTIKKWSASKKAKKISSEIRGINIKIGRRRKVRAFALD